MLEIEQFLFDIECLTKREGVFLLDLGHFIELTWYMRKSASASLQIDTVFIRL